MEKRDFRKYFNDLRSTKINAQNLWNNDIIDSFSEYVNSDEENSLNMYSLALEIAIRLYSLRIDNLHSQLVRFATSLKKMNCDSILEENIEEENRSKKTSLRRDCSEKISIIMQPETFLKKLPKLQIHYFDKTQSNENSFVNNSWSYSKIIDRWKCILPYENSSGFLNERINSNSYLKYKIKLPNIHNNSIVPTYCSFMDNLFPTVELEEPEIIEKIDIRNKSEYIVKVEKRKNNFEAKVVPLKFSLNGIEESFFKKLQNPIMPPYISEDKITLKEPFDFSMLEESPLFYVPSASSSHINYIPGISNNQQTDQKSNKMHKIYFNATLENYNMNSMKELLWNNLLDCTDNFENNTTFNELHKKISTLAIPEMKKNIKTAVYLVALLHLANECNLKLETIPNNDISIGLG